MRKAQYLRDRLDRYAQIPQESAGYVEAVGSPRESFFWMLTLEYGKAANQAALEWVESVIFTSVYQKRAPIPKPRFSHTQLRFWAGMGLAVVSGLLLAAAMPNLGVGLLGKLALVILVGWCAIFQRQGERPTRSGQQREDEQPGDVV